MSVPPKLSASRITKRYGDSDAAYDALHEVSLDVAAGEFLMLVGPSGCGKSTLLNLFAGLIAPDTGTVRMDGAPIAGPNPERSVIFQDGALFPWLSVRQNVEFGLRQAGVGPGERRDRAQTALARLGLSQFDDRAIHELSGGMRQRVAIARSMVLNPSVLLMDEPFSALDELTRQDLYAELQDLWAESDTTVVFVTHNVREAVVLGDRIAIMSPRPGRIIDILPIDILRPRLIEDTDVARFAQDIAQLMKNAPSTHLILPTHETLQETPLLRSASRAVGPGR